MRKRIAWALSILGALGISLAAWIGLTLRRAESELLRHEARVDRDIVALRERLVKAQTAARTLKLHDRTLAALRGTGPVSREEQDLWLWKMLEPVHSAARNVLIGLNDPGHFYPYEHGSDRSRLMVWLHWPEADLIRPEHVLIALGFVAEFERGMGLWDSNGLSGEVAILSRWGKLLQTQTFPPFELDQMAQALDHLRATRPAPEERFAAQYAWKSRTLIKGVREARGSTLDNRDLRPGWRSMFSRKIELVRILNEFEADLRAVEAIIKLPIWKRSEAAERRLREEGRFREEEDARQGGRPFELDASALLQWTLARVATAIAWYESEKGERPLTLDALLPRYLPQVPVCPRTGKPLTYRPGEVSSTAGPDPNFTTDTDIPLMVWKIRSR